MPKRRRGSAGSGENSTGSAEKENRLFWPVGMFTAHILWYDGNINDREAWVFPPKGRGGG